MRIFVTGASGWIGTPSVRKLVEAGHAVNGLARSGRAAAVVAAGGATAVRGSLDDLDVLAAEAARSDGVVHLAFRHDIAFTGDYEGASASDRAAIDTFGTVLADSDRPLLIASGTLGLAPGRVGTERDMPEASANARHANAEATLALATRGVRSIVVRFAPTVHGTGDRGFVNTLVNIARETGVSGYLGDGTNRWPAVHVSDAADLVWRAIEKAPAGSVLHATAEEGIATRAIAETIGQHLSVPVAQIPAEKAMEHFRFLGGFFGTDAPASSSLTRESLDWQPTGPGLLEDIAAGAYKPE